jgi:hypothetical protein
VRPPRGTERAPIGQCVRVDDHARRVVGEVLVRIDEYEHWALSMTARNITTVRKLVELADTDASARR